MNQDEAQKCFEMAESCFKKGDYAQAKKLFLKSNGLNPSPRANEYISYCINKMNENANKENNINSESKTNSSRKKSDEKCQNCSQSQNYTKEQLEIVNKIKKQKDFYEILGVSKTSKEDEIKRSYKKLAIKCHPDKNRAPGSIDAFKKIAQAYDCLTNVDKRATYDRYGNEDPDAHQQHYYQYYSQDISPDDIFDFFFSNSFGHQNMYERRRYRQQQQQQQYGPEQQARNQRAGGFFQFLPLFVIVLSTIFYNLFQTEPPISFQPSYKYNQKKETSNLQIKYFVDKNFYENFGKYPQKLNELEDEIESTFLDNLLNECSNKQGYKQRLLYQANYYNGKDKQFIINQANKVSLESCEQYKNYKPNINYIYARQFIN